jgi:hypothetical protein
MDYSHISLLKQMLDQGVPESRAVEYFQKEGFTESDVLRAINDYEGQKSATDAMKSFQKAPLSMEGHAAKVVPKRPEALPARVLMATLVVLLLAFLMIGVMLILK